MSYRVHSSHVEALHGGRTVAPGERVSDAVAKQNPRLIERGVLVKEEAERRKSTPRKAESGQQPAESPAPEQGKEE